ncbi:CHAP domain-containing protein [Clostridium polyendosporum]|uniref:CHAP domain-containing protein n=1 Tax=Clostridium polyendosporum TaxID=69208 RepID=A0A919RYV5_9CLOT|nr:CHAP domain-containing protein [Clostridium polyendosporum]GIM29007.1 CHAP domain-containing protein [Clostridium polyendosporum]
MKVRNNSLRLIFYIFIAIFLTIVFGTIISFITAISYKYSDEIGKVVDVYKNVEIYNNGEDSKKVFEINKSQDGYIYGYKWQCVEFINRYYHDALHFSILGGGNANEYFDTNVKNGELNAKRGLIQFKNGDGDKPKVDDIVVFTNGEYGHLAIISKVKEEYVEIVQQNVYGKTRDKLRITYKDDKPFIGEGKSIAGWLRKD